MIDSVLVWRRLRRRDRRRAVWAVAVVAALGAALAGAQPAATTGVDELLSFAAALLIVWSAANSARWTWPVLAAGGAALADLPWLGVGLVALVLSFVSILEVKRDRVAGAIIGALAVQGLFRLSSNNVAFAVPTIVALATSLPCVLSAVWSTKAERRGRILVAGAVGFGVVALLTLTAAGAVVSARSDVSAGIVDAQAALDSIRADDRTAAAAKFRDAQSRFDKAGGHVRAPWIAVGRAVPIVSQQLKAVDELSAIGAALTFTSAQTIEELDLDSLTFTDGKIDLDRVAALETPAARVVDDTEAALAAIAAARNGWHLPQLTARVDLLEAQLSDALPTLQNTVDAIRATPWLLGADDERRYLVLFSTPAESRELGGFVGAYGFLTADNGSLSFETKGSTGALSLMLGQAGASLPQGVVFPSAFTIQRPEIFPQAWTGTADFPAGASVALNSLRQIDPRGADGVLVADPYALEAMLGFTGPITAPGIGRTLDQGNVIEFLLRQQYNEFELEDQGERKDLLGDVAEAVFDELISGALPAPPTVATALGPIVGDRRLLFTVDDPDTDALLTTVGLTGSLRSYEGRDVFTVVDTNLRANKLDAYIDRSIDFDGLLRVDGKLIGELTVTIDNNVPLTGLNEYVTGDAGVNLDGFPEGDHYMFAGVYSTLNITGVTVDGEETVLGFEPAYGMTRYSALVRIPHRQSVEVVFTIEDAVDRDTFELEWIPYASANPDSVTINITRR